MDKNKLIEKVCESDNFPIIPKIGDYFTFRELNDKYDDKDLDYIMELVDINRSIDYYDLEEDSAEGMKDLFTGNNCVIDDMVAVLVPIKKSSGAFPYSNKFTISLEHLVWSIMPEHDEHELEYEDAQIRYIPRDSIKGQNIELYKIYKAYDKQFPGMLDKDQRLYIGDKFKCKIHVNYGDGEKMTLVSTTIEAVKLCAYDDNPASIFDFWSSIVVHFNDGNNINFTDNISVPEFIIKLTRVQLIAGGE